MEYDAHGVKLPHVQTKQSGFHTKDTGNIVEHSSEKQYNQIYFLDVALIVQERSGM